ncbi:uncharacterized protein LOC127007891 isoform X2 [Eriocheir sinensis]|uniref:uncharacterized protein LOC127007891 isoform X2 n=1 Tax=Eriocheir sinensis TaxID=95602 RepID=UPI0021C89682|nr:uncharacterized protein LOC127007891 isoform X2 [Eriocheir sinensis]
MDFSSVSPGEKLDSQLEVHEEKEEFSESHAVRVKAPGVSAASIASAQTDSIHGKSSGTQLTGSQDSKGKGGGVHSPQTLKQKREKGSAEEKWGSSESRAPLTHSLTVDAPDGIKSDIRHIMSRQRSASLASLEYYRTEDTTLQVSAPEDVPGADGVNQAPPDRHFQQSRRLPFWMWLIIAKSLGIKLHAQDKPILATALYLLTFASASGFILSNWWFYGYDMASDYTKTTVIDAAVSMFYTLLWGALGLYSNKLAFKLFSHTKFLDMLRLHSKTILKMNASVVLFSLMLLIVIFNNISAFPDFRAKACEAVGVEVLVCRTRYIFRVIYSFFAVLWNYLVAFVLVSTCRTHVIGIRRFMKALEKDARTYESGLMGQAQPPAAETPVLEEYTWVDEDYLDELIEPSPSDEHEPGSSILSRRQRHSGESHGREQEAPPSPPARGPAATVPCQGSFSPMPSTLSEPLPNARKSRLKMSSMALQRWMMSIISLVVMWLAMNLVIWLNINPSLIDLANFFLPLSLLPLLASAYAEVNQEGQRLIKFICPLEERLQLIYVLQMSPLQMTVYGFSLTYSTITTAAFGILLAFASKVLIQEISGGMVTAASPR